MFNRLMQKMRHKLPGGATDAAKEAGKTGAAGNSSPEILAPGETAGNPTTAEPGREGSLATQPNSQKTGAKKSPAAPLPFKPPRPPAWQSGEIILEHYHIDRELTPCPAGGRSYLCRHLAWGLFLRLETPPPERLQAPKGLKSCIERAEARVKTGLHPNVIASYNLRFVERLPVMISEYVEGLSLAQWLEQQPGVNPRIALSLAIQGCHGLEHCHHMGLRHGDIRPENLFINPGSLLKIGGLGLAPPPASTTENSDLQAFGRCLQRLFKPAVGDTEAVGNRCKALQIALWRSTSSDPERQYGNFAELRRDLNRAYRELFNMPCPYHEPPLLDQRAEVLNNQALFLLEEGRNQEAARKLARCLEINDILPEGAYNELLMRWRLNEISPGLVLRRIEANRRPGLDREAKKLWRRLEKVAKLNITGLKNDFDQDQEALPEYRLAPPPRRLAVYRRGPTRRQAEEKIHDHLVNRRWQGCFESLLAAWQPEGFRKDRFFNRIYEELLLSREKLLPIQGQRFLTLTGHRAPVISLARIPDTRRIASVGGDGRLLIHDLGELGQGNQPGVTENHELPISCLAVAPGGKNLAVGTRQGGVHLVSAKSGKILGQEQSHRAPVSALAYSYDGKLLASAAEDGSITVRRLATGREDGVSLADSGRISTLLYPDQELGVISGSEDGLLRHWQSRLRDCTATIQAHGGAVYALAADAAGDRLISAGADRRVRVWPRQGENCLHNIKAPGGRLRAVLGLADGRTMAYAGDDDLIHLREIASGNLLFSLDSRGGGIRSLAPGPRSHTLLAGRADGTICVWLLIYQLNFDIL